jgi:hypothetical protein
MQYSSWDQWDTKKYLRQYFSHIEPEEEAVLEFLVQRLGIIKEKYPVLQFGCGPSIAEVLPAVPYASEIHMVDYLPVNIQEIQSWMNKDSKAFHWNRFTGFVLKLERMPYAISDIVNREEELRKKIKHVGLCDAGTFPPILGQWQHYPIVITTFCADSATSSKEIWRTYMKNILRLVAPSGHLFLAALRNTNYYVLGDTVFPCPHINEHDIFDILLEGDYDKNNIDLVVKDIPEAGNRGFDGIVLVHAIRNYG